jgi:hypothetical protein
LFYYTFFVAAQMKAVFLAAFICCCVGIAQAQTPDPPACVPDCPTDLFGPMQSTLLQVGSCWVTVYWRERLACGIWHDVYIDEFIATPFGCDTPPYDLFQKQVVAALLLANPMGFPPDTVGDPCNSNWRVSKGACWLRDWILIPQPEFVAYRPCYFQQEICCLERYQVCLTESGRQVTFLGGPPAPSCPGVVGPLRGQCFPTCNSVY